MAALYLLVGVAPTAQQALLEHPHCFFVPQISRSSERSRALICCYQRFASISALNCSSSTTAAAAAAADEVSVDKVPRRRLIAQNIPWTSTAEDIKNLFQSHGTVVDVELSMYNKVKNRGLAFITMASEEDALAALNNLTSYDLDGRIIKVEFARSLKKSPSLKTTLPVTKYKVFIGNLAWRVRSRDLQQLFNVNDNVLSAEVVYQTNPRRSAGYGFVSFASKDAAEAAIETFNGKRLMGRPIRLVFGKIHTSGSEGKSNDTQQFDEESSEVKSAEGKSNDTKQFDEESSEVKAGEDLAKEAVDA